jgi:hypothetical protein
VTANDATASTLAYACDPDGALGSTAISAASASLANAPAGALVAMRSSVVGDAALFSATGVVGGGPGGGIIVPPGIITLTVAVGSTTGTWRHHIRWNRIDDGAEVIVA